MFKEVCIIIFVIILIVSANFFIQNYLDKTSNELADNLEEIYIYIKDKENIDYEKIKNKSNDLKNKWEDTEKVWSVIVLHSELDMVDKTFTNFNTAIENENIDEAYLKNKELQLLITRIAERDSFKLKNIF